MNRLSRVKQNKIFTKGDWLVIAVALILIVVMFLLAIQTGEVGVTVEIYESGNLVKTIGLNAEDSYLYTANGGSNLIVVKNGTVHIETASCRDQLCVNKGEIRTGGEQIICLPNGLRIAISGEGEIDGIV